MKTQHITKEKFAIFKKIKQSGEISMLDFSKVAIVARSKHKIKLTSSDCFNIYRDYATYEKQFNN